MSDTHAKHTSQCMHLQERAHAHACTYIQTCTHLQVAEIEAAEKEKMREKCMKIINHNINCFIDRQLIYNFPEEIFADHGVMAIGVCLCVCVCVCVSLWV